MRIKDRIDYTVKEFEDNVREYEKTLSCLIGFMAC